MFNIRLTGQHFWARAMQNIPKKMTDAQEREKSGMKFVFFNKHNTSQRVMTCYFLSTVTPYLTSTLSFT